MPFIYDCQDLPPLGREYLLPYNGIEIQRLREQQRSMTDLFEGRILLAPVELADGDEVLDVASGSGAWALDFSERYPKANTTRITCVDIASDMFPKRHPANMTFQVGSALALPSNWTNRFALVHQRLVVCGIMYDDWERDIRELYRVTAPGGWAQLCEWNNQAYDYEAAGIKRQPGKAEARAIDLFMRVGRASGKDYLCAARIAALMEAAGFIDVRKEERVIPLGAWNGDLSHRFAKNLATVFRGTKDAVVSNGGLGVVQTGGEYDELIDQVESDWAARPGGYDSFAVFIGRKI